MHHRFKFKYADSVFIHDGPSKVRQGLVINRWLEEKTMGDGNLVECYEVLLWQDGTLSSSGDFDVEKLTFCE